MQDLKTQILNALNERATYIMEKAPELVAYTLSEMEDAPDQQVQPLTRDQVQKLLFNYESRVEAESLFNFASERSIGGMLRVNKVIPDFSADWESGNLNNADGQDPGKLVAWQYVIDMTPDDLKESDEPDETAGDTFNKEEGLKNFIASLESSVIAGTDVLVELADGNDVYLSPADVSLLLTAGVAEDLLYATSDIQKFGSFISTYHNPVDVYGNVEQESE